MIGGRAPPWLLAALTPRVPLMRRSSGRRITIVTTGGPVLYMVIERFRGGDPVPVYPDFQCCYQVMECDERDLLEAWMAQWHDLVEFEVIPVRTSVDAAALLAPKL